ncbi:MAG: hypothetical protein JWQ68_1284 [Cryobacterium sp.]|jgi:predicted lipoprotein with Yx(FWY)xxD motif|nr:hypothetical protein [Cryobacterium sp.]
MNKKLRVGFAGVALSVLALAACSQSSPSSAPAEDTSSRSEAPSPSQSSSDAVLATADSSLGTIVVDAEGMTVYVFDKDAANSGTSSCEGDCLAAWPPVVATSDDPAADGVSGDLGVITRTDDGSKQVTLNGLPLYYYVKDEAAGDVTGQAVGGVWWVISEDGTKITEGAAG